MDKIEQIRIFLGYWFIGIVLTTIKLCGTLNPREYSWKEFEEKYGLRTLLEASIWPVSLTVGIGFGMSVLWQKWIET